MNSKTRDRIRPVGIDRLPGPIGTGLQATMEAYFSATSSGGLDVMAETWDQLLILDGCRYDMFERLNTIDGELQARTSVATETPEFLDRTFGGQQYPDTVYVTANPIHRVEEWCEVDLDDVFHDVIDVWQEQWDDTVGTVPPEKMAATLPEIREQYPDRRLIAHFVQPHYPFIGPTGKYLEHGRMNGKKRVEGGGPDADETPVWELLRDGDTTPERVRQAYEENLWYALPYVRSLLQTFGGRTVVTSDHGNHVGEIAVPFPVRLYGHPPGIRTPELVTVPWLTVQNEQPVQSRNDRSKITQRAGVSSTDGGRGVQNTGQDTGTVPPAASVTGYDRRLREGPLVSVVIPTHYRNEQLELAIESVREQRYEPIEIVVVDDSGEGHARPVTDSREISYIEHDKQRGANVARNTGIETASGTYVQLLDDDDRLHPEKIPRQVAVLENAPAADVVYCGYASDTGLRLPNPDVRGDVVEAALEFGPKACTNSTMLITGELLEQITLSDTDGADDIGFCIDLAVRSQFEVVTDALVYKENSGDSRSEDPAVGRELLNVIEKYDSLYAEYPPEVRRAALQKAYRTLGRNTLREEEWSPTAVSGFYESLKYRDEKSAADLALPVAALFGSPGFRVASWIYSYVSD